MIGRALKREYFTTSTLFGWGQIRSVLNEGLLPEGYYALAEQHAGDAIADVLTLHGTAATPSAPIAPPAGGTAVADAPPRVRYQRTLDGTLAMRRRTLAVRHVSGHRLVALLEIVSPANKDRVRHVAAFAEKAVSALEAGIHLLVVDLFPPGLHDPQGIHGAIVASLAGAEDPDDLPALNP